MIFRVQKKVGVHNGHTAGHHREDEEDQEHEAVHVVDLVLPEGGEHKVHLNEDGPKGEDPPEEDDHQGVRVPLFLRDLPGDGVHPAGEIWLPTPVFSDDGAQEGQRVDQEEPNGDDGHEGAKVDGPGARVVEGHDIVQDGHNGNNGGPQEDRHHHVPDPVLAPIPGVEAPRVITGDHRSEGIQEDGRS